MFYEFYLFRAWEPIHTRCNDATEFETIDRHVGGTFDVNTSNEYRNAKVWYFCDKSCRLQTAYFDWCTVPRTAVCKHTQVYDGSNYRRQNDVTVTLCVDRRTNTDRQSRHKTGATVDYLFFNAPSSGRPAQKRRLALLRHEITDHRAIRNGMARDLDWHDDAMGGLGNLRLEAPSW